MLRLAVTSLCLMLFAVPVGFARQQNSGYQAHQAQRQQPRSQHPKAGEWLRKYKDMPPAEQEKALASDPQFQKLPAERQQKLRERLHEFNNMPPERQQKVLNRMEAFDQLTPQQRQQARDLNGRLKEIAPERRVQMRIALRNLRQMDPGQQERVMNSDQFRSRFNDNEREILRGMLQLPIGPGAQPKNESAPAGQISKPQ